MLHAQRSTLALSSRTGAKCPNRGAPVQMASVVALQGILSFWHRISATTQTQPVEPLQAASRPRDQVAGRQRWTASH